MKFFKQTNRRPELHKFLDANDYQEYIKLSLPELLEEERAVIMQIRQTNNLDTLRYLKADLETIRRALQDVYNDKIQNRFIK